MDLISIPLSVVFQIAILSGFVGAFVVFISGPFMLWFFRCVEPLLSFISRPLFWCLARRLVSRYPMSQIRRRLVLRQKARAHRIAD
ncbi:hypothetical protein [Aquitalea sp. ASV11]|uniref:hypothetical protein n=1 Tax=Aquitalea sp. ASV11 TaxID=2795103 RepID=UPI0018ED521E|nr:hypothetical protein [Aquitalea sp. ASV11]